MRWTRPRWTRVLYGVLGLWGCERDVESSREMDAAVESTTASCLAGDAGADAWLCPGARTVECGESLPSLALPPGDPRCQEPLTRSVPEPLLPGMHAVRILGRDGGVVCEAPLTVVDTRPPVFTPQVTRLWPPNHKLHAIDARSCGAVEDRCAADVRTHFTWVSSDEAVEGAGAGKGGADIVVAGCDRIELRAERRGGGDGRVYRLGVRAVDGAGNATEGVCTVVVPHDQSGREPLSSGEAYRITLNGADGTPNCIDAGT